MGRHGEDFDDPFLRFEAAVARGTMRNVTPEQVSQEQSGTLQADSGDLAGLGRPESSERLPDGLVSGEMLPDSVLEEMAREMDDGSAEPFADEDLVPEYSPLADFVPEMDRDARDRFSDLADDPMELPEGYDGSRGREPAEAEADLVSGNPGAPIDGREAAGAAIDANGRHLPDPDTEQVAQDLIEDLSEEQRAAAMEFERPVLILSGAGSGKTRTLIGRLARLLAPPEAGGFGVDPDSVMMVTFTNKAAREMRERLQPILDGLEKSGRIAAGSRRPLWIGTFHSLSLEILRTHARKAGLEQNFTIIDPGEEKQLARDALERAGIGKETLAPDGLLELIERAKNQALSPEFLSDEIEALGGLADPRLREFENPKVLDAYRHYQDALRRDNGVDFADLLNAAITLFKEHEDIARHWRSRIRHFLVDEFQDVNPAQMQWLSMFMRGGGLTEPSEADPMFADRVEDWPRPTIALAGDEDQTIYTFRGSDVSIILGFEDYFPDGVVRKLETNYRCQPLVLELANNLISHNRGRREKTLRPGEGVPPANKVWLRRTGRPDQHVGEIVAEIAAEIGRGASPSEFAILARTGAALKDFEDRLKENDIPCQMYGSVDMSQREEIRDALAFAELVVNPQASLSFRRVCNKPARGISTETVQKLNARAISLNEGIVNVARYVAEGGIQIEGLRPRAVDALSDFLGLIGRLRIETLEMPPDQALDHILKQTGYLDDLEQDRGAEGSRAGLRIYNLNRLKDIAARFWADYREEIGKVPGAIAGSDRAPLAVFHENFLMEGRDAAREASRGVAIMTMHAAKGLEFDRVYLPYFMAGISPHANAAAEGDAGLEEERRLAYVAFTRARKHLTITWPDSMPAWAGRKVAGDRLQSPFILEALLPEGSSPAELSANRERLVEETGLARRQKRYDSRPKARQRNDGARIRLRDHIGGRSSPGEPLPAP